MTGYHISVGYNADISPAETKQAWEKIGALFNSLTRKEIKEEYLKYETLTQCSEGCCKLDDFIERFFTRDDATVRFIERDGENEIMMLASGGEEPRLMKEGLRRAVCRLMLQKAHKEHFEININVA